MDKKIEQTIMEHVDDVVKHSSDCLRHDIAEIVSLAIKKEREKIALVFETNVIIDENEVEDEWYQNLKLKMREALGMYKD